MAAEEGIQESFQLRESLARNCCNSHEHNGEPSVESDMLVLVNYDSPWEHDFDGL